MQNNITNDLQIKVKEEYASLVPQQSDAEYQALKASISERGLIHAIIVTPQGYILDRHHRKKACDELGILPRYQVRDFKGDSALEKRFIVETNCIRRSINLFQKIEMAYKAQPIYAELANRRRLAGLKHTKVSSSESSSVQKNTNDYEGRRVIDICAKRMGISASSYHMGRKILQSQVGPEVLQDLRYEKRSVHAVYKSLQKQDSSASRPHHHKATRTAANADRLPSLKETDIQSYFDAEKATPSNSVDLLVTFLRAKDDHGDTPLYLRWSAERLLIHRGLFFVAGVQEPEEFKKKLEGIHLVYRGLFGNSDSSQHKGAVQVKLDTGPQNILVFSRKTDGDPINFKELSAVNLPGNMVDPEVAIEYIIDKFSPKSGIVCDPILGYGNTAIAALKLGRQFIGWRMGSKTVETIQRRIESRDRSQLSWAA